jgi:hypothetical protein
MNKLNIVEELKAKRDFENKVILEVEKVSEVDQVFDIQKKLDKQVALIKTLKSELSEKMTIVEASLPKEVYEYLFGTSKTSVRNTSKGTTKKEIALRVINGEKLSEVAASLYPDREAKDRNYLAYRHLLECEKDGLIKIVEKAVAVNQYSTVKVEKVVDF